MTTVSFGENAASDVNVVSPTQITAVSPAGSAGVVDVTVTTATGKSATSTADKFTYASALAGNTKSLLMDFDSTSYDWATVAPQYDAISLNSWNYAWIPAIKAANPDCMVLVYKDTSSVRTDSCTGGTGDSCLSSGGLFAPAGVEDAAYLATGVGFCYAWRNHPEWFLKDASGDYIIEAGYSTQYMTDFGSAAYQAQWLANVIADVQTNGWDGVHMDNVLNYDNYGTPASYPTAAAVQAAMLSMLKVVGPGLQDAGITVVGNLGYNNLYPALWAEWLPYLSGLMDEFYMYWGDNSLNGTGTYWTTLEEEVQAAVSQGKTCFFNVGGGTLTTAQIDYALASLLLYTDGNQYIAYGGSSDDTQNPIYTLGAATSAATESGGVYRRTFANGSVSVNPTTQVGTITVG
jgi:hypothetical protein